MPVAILPLGWTAAVRCVFGPFVINGYLFFFVCAFVVWLSATSNIPERSFPISKYELNYILSKRQYSPPLNAGKTQKVKVISPFKRLLSKLPTWSLMVAYAMHRVVILSCIPLLKVYYVDLRKQHGLVLFHGPLTFVAYFGGAWSDTLIHRGLSVTLTRKIMQSIGFIGPAIALLLGLHYVLWTKVI